MKKNFTYSIDKELEKKLDEFASKLYRSKSSVVQQAIIELIQRHEQTKD